MKHTDYDGFIEDGFQEKCLTRHLENFWVKTEIVRGIECGTVKIGFATTWT